MIRDSCGKRNVLGVDIPTPAEIQRLLKAGAPKYGPHSLRHYFASWCINRKSDGGRELPAKNVQELLGHSSIMMTLDLYGHLFTIGQ
jgi:integrase